MSVLIKGMDMPKEPKQCKLRKVDEESGDIFESAWCVISKHYCGYSFPIDCPLIEVPTPHGDLIDRDELQKKFDLAQKSFMGCENCESAPTTYEEYCMGNGCADAFTENAKKCNNYENESEVRNGI